MKKILLTFVAILCAGIAGIGSQFAHAESPALRLIVHFESSNTDSAANGYFAEPSSGQVAYVPGKIGQAGSFDPNAPGGTNFIYQKYPAIGASDFSISAWINISSAAGVAGNTIASVAGNGGTPCENGASQSGHLGYAFGTANGRLQFQYCYNPNGNDDAANTAGALSGQKVITDGTWHFVAITRNAQTLSLYVDGISDATTTTPNVINFDFNPASQWYGTDGLLVGEIDTANSVAEQERYNGLLDEFAIFDRTLSAQEINCFYNSGAGKEVDRNETQCVVATPAPAPTPSPTPAPVPTGSKEPVVIIPGIMGSLINRASDGREAWPNGPKMGSLAEIRSGDAYLNDLKLDANGKPIIAMTTPDIVRTVTSSLPNVPFHGDFYQPLVDLFANNGYTENKDLFVAPYDWRLDPATQANAIGAKIAMAASSSPNGKVNIIAHSLGGLVLKQYLGGLHHPAFIDKVILAGVPQLGSPEAFKALNYGDNLDIPILSAQKIKDIGQNMAGLYTLLPGRKYIQTAGGYVEDFRNTNARVLDYAATNALMLHDPSDSRNPSLLSLSDTLHQRLDEQTVAAPNVYNIVGCLNPTISQFNVYDHNVVDVERNSGDGTVPEVSAMNMANGFSNYFVLGNETGIDHQGLVKDQRLLALIKNIIDGAPVSSSLPDGISTAAADCLTPRAQYKKETTIEFSTHSPVDLNVYDLQNRHTGPNSAGYIDLDIPGSTYGKIGENSFVTVPAGGVYRTIEQALASGTFTMKVKGYAGGDVDNEATYLSVPLQSPDTKAKLDFSGFQTDMTLQLDKNGDGRVDSKIKPTAILNPTNGASDVVPPALAMPQIPSQVIAGTRMQLIFGASDADSGIAIMTATLNGAKVSSGKEIMLGKYGKNAFVLEAVDKAGNPSADEIDFTVVAAASFSPSADTYVSSKTANKNYGLESDLNVSEKERGLLGFDQNKLREKIGTARIISAKIELNVLRGSSSWKNGSILDLMRMSRDWTERGATWNCANDDRAGNAKPDCKSTAWNMAGSPLPFAASVSTSTETSNNPAGSITLDVTEDVKQFLNGTLPNYGWMIRKRDETLPGSIAFSSGETREAPKLTVVYEP